MKASEHAQAWKTAHDALAGILLWPSLSQEIRNNVLIAQHVCAAAFDGYTAVAKEQEEQHG